jgi:hypothetical protein
MCCLISLSLTPPGKNPILHGINLTNGNMDQGKASFLQGDSNVSTSTTEASAQGSDPYVYEAPKTPILHGVEPTIASTREAPKTPILHGVEPPIASTQEAPKTPILHGDLKTPILHGDKSLVH